MTLFCSASIFSQKTSAARRVHHCDLLTVSVAHDEAIRRYLNGPRRREAAIGHRGLIKRHV
jgi:hypothetical protein